MLVRSVAARSRAPFAAMVVVALAFAVAVPLAASASPLANLDFTLLLTSQGTGNPLLLVAGQLPEGTPLPAELVLPVPEGSVVEWSGEILGETVEEDQAVPATIETRDGVTVAVLTMTQSRVGQVEVSFPGAIAPAEGDVITGGFGVTSPVEVGAARVAVAFPPGTEAAELPEGALSAQGPQGYTYYYQELSDVAPGDPIGFSVKYRQVAAPTGAPGTQPASGEVPPLLIVLIAAVLAGAVLAVLASRARSKGIAADEFEADEAVDDLDGEYSAVSDDDSRAVDLIVSESDSESEYESISEPTPASTSWLTPQRLLIIAGVLVVGIIAAVILGGQQGQVGVTESADGWITQRISAASGDSALELSVQIACECPPEEEAPKMFEVLRQVPGVAYAALQGSTLLLRIEYDPALTNEAAIALALRGAGYLP
jgi:hypothetical protein